MDNSRTLKLSNIRTNVRFTGDRDNKYYYNTFVNADGGPMTIIRETDKFAPAYTKGTQITGTVWPDKITVKNADGTDVQSYTFITTKYNGQDVFIPLPDLGISLNGGYYVKSNNVFPWFPSVNNPNRQSTTGNTSGNTNNGGGSGATNNGTTGKWSATKIIITAIGSAVVVGGGFVFVKWLINRGKNK